MSRSPATVSSAAAAQQHADVVPVLARSDETRAVPAGHLKAARVGWRLAVAWFAIALAGQGAALLLIDAGTRLHYQHYRVNPATLAGDRWLWALVAVQAVVVAIAWGRMRQAGSWWTRPLSVPSLVAALAVMWVTSGIISHELWAYPLELTFATLIQVVALGTVILGVGALPASRRMAAIGRWLLCRDRPAPAHRADAVTWAMAAAVTAVAAMLNVFVYERHPHIPDEVVYLLQANYFAEGRLWLPLPPVPRAFDVDLMFVDAARWFSPVPPGWPAILALGALVSASWLVNPVLAGLCIWLTWKLLTELYAPAVARLATLLLCLSPWHLFMGMSYMTHTATLACALTAALATALGHRHGRLRWFVLAGVAAGGVSLIRPLEGLAVVLVLGPLCLWTRGRWSLKPALAFGAAFALTASLVLPYNAALTGDPLAFPIMAYVDKYYAPNANALGFGPERGLGWAIDPRPGHTPLEGAVNTLVNAAQLNVELFGWGCGSLAGVLALFVLGRWQRVDLLLLAASACIVGLHFFYWYTGGPDFGPRYWFLVVVPFVALTARGIQEIEGAFDSRAAGRAVMAALVLSAMAAVTFIPWRAVDKYRHFRGMRSGVVQLARDHRFGDSLVLIRGKRYPDWSSAVVYNPTNLRSGRGPVFAWDRDEQARRAVVQAFADRPVWLVNGPTVTGRGFEVAAGPLQADSLLRQNDGRDDPASPGLPDDRDRK
jgi:hypothetical protein